MAATWWVWVWSPRQSRWRLADRCTSNWEACALARGLHDRGHTAQACPAGRVPA